MKVKRDQIQRSCNQHEREGEGETGILCLWLILCLSILFSWNYILAKGILWDVIQKYKGLVLLLHQGNIPPSNLVSKLVMGSPFVFFFFRLPFPFLLLWNVEGRCLSNLTRDPPPSSSVTTVFGKNIETLWGVSWTGFRMLSVKSTPETKVPLALCYCVMQIRMKLVFANVNIRFYVTRKGEEVMNKY